MTAGKKDMLCAIPARIGSKRLERKNIRPLLGKPMIAYTIKAALESGLFDAVYVCTEDDGIRRTAESLGALVPMLMDPADCNDDVSSLVPCLRLADYLAEQGQKHEALLCLQPTSPLRTAAEIREACRQFRESGNDFLVSVTPVDPHYFHWALRQDEAGEWGFYFGEQYLKERIHLPAVHRPNGSIKIGQIGALKETGHFFGKKLSVMETPAETSVHVGDLSDFRYCEFLLNTANAHA